MTRIDGYLTDIAGASDLLQLKDCLQKIAEAYGFASFNFLDVGNPHVDVPFYMGTTGEAWESDYRSNGFVHIDHCVKFARRSNLPFNWDEVPLPEHTVGPKPGYRRLYEAASDHGFKNGLVVPFHYRDRLGRNYSSLCVFYWKDTLSRFKFMLRQKKLDLHIVLIYWVQRAIDVLAETRRSEGEPRLGVGHVDFGEAALTDRERDVLSWAARGKTAAETSDILSISEETVSTHLRSSMRKLSANNKTHATVRAIYLGLIDV